MNRQKELDAGPKATRKIDLLDGLKKSDNNGNATDAGKWPIHVCLNNFRKKTKRTRLKRFQESLTVL